jgi:hypothetical protein
VSLFKPPDEALSPLNRLNAMFVLVVDRVAKSPHLFNWLMGSAIDFITQGCQDIQGGPVQRAHGVQLAQGLQTRGARDLQRTRSRST